MPRPLPHRIDLSPADVGNRVTVRRMLPTGRLGDVVGELVSWREGRLTIRRRDGSLAEVEWSDLVAGRPVRAIRPRP
ncbi:MAG TPA: hypothetical protein VNG13_02220 [Mycobacteriales bacterium]|nr:hypothetical protein [Mycobacteriales bacterium]